MRKLFVILAAGALLTSGAAQAAPVATNATLGVEIEGLAPLTIGGSGSVSVVGSTVVVPAGLVALPGGTTLIIPVTGTTAIAQLIVPKLANLAGTFSPNGILTSEICPVGGPNALSNGSGGEACNAGGGIGGVLALTGTIGVVVNPSVIIPVNLNAARIGQGGSTNTPFSIDAANWSTGNGFVNTGVNVSTLTAGTGSPLTLVSPTFVSALGNLLPIFATFTFTNISLAVPEPGSILLIGTGIAGLALLGSRRK